MDFWPTRKFGENDGSRCKLNKMVLRPKLKWTLKQENVELRPEFLGDGTF